MSIKDLAQLTHKKKNDLSRPVVIVIAISPALLYTNISTYGVLYEAKRSEASLRGKREASYDKNVLRFISSEMKINNRLIMLLEMSSLYGRHKL